MSKNTCGPWAEYCFCPAGSSVAQPSQIFCRYALSTAPGWAEAFVAFWAKAGIVMQTASARTAIRFIIIVSSKRRSIFAYAAQPRQPEREIQVLGAAGAECRTFVICPGDAD